MILYRIVNSLLRLINSYFSYILEQFEVSEMFFSCIYVSIVLMDFKLAEWLYDNILSELYSKNEKLLQGQILLRMDRNQTKKGETISN